MDAVIPCARLIGLIKPHYPKAGQGRQPLGLEKMLRIYFLQQWLDLSDLCVANCWFVSKISNSPHTGPVVPKVIALSAIVGRENSVSRYTTG
jgi:hypothetical protein